jgi:lactate dehydrogenase-like 2-hydroxyacid dehydrogenase
MKKKILVCGVGSIGERHINNLISLGYKNISLYRVRNLPFRILNHDLPVYDSLDEALKQCPDIAFICNPTHFIF